MPRPMPEHLKVLLENIAQKANETDSLEDATHKVPVGNIDPRPATIRKEASFVRTPVKGAREKGAATNARYRGHGSSNATENTRRIPVEVDGATYNVAAVKTYNRGSLGMVDHEKSQKTQLLLVMYKHGRDKESEEMLKVKLPALNDGITRVKDEVKKDLKAKIREEVLRCAAAGETFNPDNIRYMDHRYLGGVANDNEPVSELAYKIAFEEIKKEAGALVKEVVEEMQIQNVKPYLSEDTTFNNVVYNNTCLTHGKDMFGTSQPSNIPPQVEEMKSEYNKNPGGYEKEVKGEIQTRLTGDPQEWILQAEANKSKLGITDEIIRDMEKGLAAGNNIEAIKEKLGDDKEKIQNAIEYKADDMARQRTCAIKALVAMNEDGGIKRMHHNDHLVSQAAYVNIAMASDGFEVHAGCKSSLDRAGGELTTRTAYEDYIREYKEPPTRENLKKNPESAKFLATQYMSIYQETTAQIGAQNRFGLDATKTYERFVGSEAKYAMQLRTELVKGNPVYKDYVKSFAESNMDDEELLKIALAENTENIKEIISANDPALNTLEGNVDLEAIQVAAQNAFNARKIAKDAFTFDSAKKAQKANSKIKEYDENLKKTIDRMQEGKAFPYEFKMKGMQVLAPKIEQLICDEKLNNQFLEVAEKYDLFENHKSLKVGFQIAILALTIAFKIGLFKIFDLYMKRQKVIKNNKKEAADIGPDKVTREQSENNLIEPPSPGALTECEKPREHQPLAIRGELRECKKKTEGRVEPMSNVMDDQKQSTKRSEIIKRGEDDTLSL